MEPWQILGAGIGVGLIGAQLWRSRLRSRAQGLEPETIAEPSEATASNTDVWIELDVEPLFPSSEPISRDYLLDLTESSETESERPG